MGWFFNKKKAVLLYDSGKKKIELSEKRIIIQRNEKFTLDLKNNQDWIRKIDSVIEIANFALSTGISREIHALLIWDKKQKKYKLMKNKKSSTRVNDTELIEGSSMILNNKDKINLGKSLSLQIIY